MKNNAFKITVVIATMILMAVGFQYYRYNQERKAQLAFQRQELEAKQAAERAAQSKADKKAQTVWFAALTAADLELNGKTCVDEVEKQSNENEHLFGWSFSSLPPSEFNGIKTAVMMGLRATAYGSETYGMAIIREQIPNLINHQKDEYQLTSFDLITYEQYDTFGGIKHRVVKYTCRLLGPDDISIYRADTIPL